LALQKLTAAAFTLQYWDKNGTVNIAVWITIFAVIIIFVNLFGALGVGEPIYDWAIDYGG
jgi:amino acid transporter